MRISDWSSDVCSSDLIEGRSLRVADFHHLIFLLPGREHHAAQVAHRRAAQGAGYRGAPADAAGARLRLVIADQGDGAALVVLVRDGAGRAKLDLALFGLLARRSEERRVWKECVSRFRFLWSAYS